MTDGITTSWSTDGAAKVGEGKVGSRARGGTRQWRVRGGKYRRRLSQVSPEAANS